MLVLRLRAARRPYKNEDVVVRCSADPHVVIEVVCRHLGFGYAAPERAKGSTAAAAAAAAVTTLSTTTKNTAAQHKNRHVTKKTDKTIKQTQSKG